MQHHRLVKWERELRRILGRLDAYLEDRHGEMYSLHPARANRGTTANVKHDGLFNVSAKFSTGYGTEHGAGYVLDVDLVTLARIPQNVQRQIEDEAATWLRKALPEAFPDRELSIERDSGAYKICGDLSLGKV
jgi:hypothetical protein